MADSEYAEVAEYPDISERVEAAGPIEPDQAPADARPAASNSIFQRVRERGQQPDGRIAEATLEPWIASPDETAPAATASDASLPPLPLTHQAAVQQTDEQAEDAMEWAAFMSQSAGTRVHAGTHAPG